MTKDNNTLLHNSKKISHPHSFEDLLHLIRQVLVSNLIYVKDPSLFIQSEDCIGKLTD